MKTRRQRFRFAWDAAGEMPFDASAETDSEHNGREAVAVMNQNAVLNEWLTGLSFVRRTDQVSRRSVRDRRIRRERGPCEFRRPKSVVRCLPQRVSLQELHSRNTGFSAVPGLHHGLEHFQSVKVVGFDRTRVDRHCLENSGVAWNFPRRTALGERHGTSRHERNLHDPGGVIHLPGPISAIG